LQPDLVDRSANPPAVPGGGAVDRAFAVMRQRACRVAAVWAGERVNDRELAGRRDAEQRAVARLGRGAAARLGGAVEIAVGVEHQRAVGAEAVSHAGELVDDREPTRRVYLPNCA